MLLHFAQMTVLNQKYNLNKFYPQFLGSLPLIFGSHPKFKGYLPPILGAPTPNFKGTPGTKRTSIQTNQVLVKLAKKFFHS